MKNSSQEILPSWCWHARQDHLRSSRWHRKLLCMALNWTIKISQISNCKSCNKISLCVVLNIRMTCKGQKSFLSHHRNYCCCSHNTWYCVTALSWYKIDFIPAPCWFSSCHNCHQLSQISLTIFHSGHFQTLLTIFHSGDFQSSICLWYFLSCPLVCNHCTCMHLSKLNSAWLYSFLPLFFFLGGSNILILWIYSLNTPSQLSYLWSSLFSKLNHLTI